MIGTHIEIKNYIMLNFNVASGKMEHDVVINYFHGGSPNVLQNEPQVMLQCCY